MQSLHVGRSVSASRINKFLVTGAAVVTATAIAVNPLAPSLTAGAHHGSVVEMQHHEVQLASAIGDVVGAYTGVLSQAVTNLQTEGNLAAAAIPQLLQAVSGNLSSYADLIETALTGVSAAVKNSMYGGGWAADDGFVFGLFGGTITHDGVTKSGSTLQLTLGALAKGQLWNAFGYIEPWALELLDHTMKPLLSPFLNTARAGATPSATIPGIVLKIVTNVANSFLSYATLKAASKTVMAPALNVAFAVLEDLDKFGAHVSSANIEGAVADVLTLPAHVAGAILNGYTLKDPALNPSGAAFSGLLNKGGVLDLLLVTWPKQLATAINAATPVKAAATAAAASVAAVDPVDTVDTDATEAATAKVLTADTPRATKATAGSKAPSAQRNSSGKRSGAASSAPKKDAGKGHSPRDHAKASDSDAA